MLRVGLLSGFLAPVLSLCRLPPRSHLQRAFIRAETAKGEKTILANKLFISR